jgi:hypothetical protein
VAVEKGVAAPEKIERIDLATLKDMSVGALTKIAKQLDVPGATGSSRSKYARVRSANSWADSAPPRAYPYPGRSTRYTFPELPLATE